MKRVANYRLTDAHIKEALNVAADSDARVATALNDWQPELHCALAAKRQGKPAN